MKVLSLFDGISCGRVALERAGIYVEKYYASEIDKYAIQVAKAMYPDSIQIGDVCKVDFTQYIGKVDMIIGGSPCQDLSIAKQNRQGLNGERSRLFWEYIKALSVIKPKYFLLENVASMKKQDRDAITSVLKAIYPETECVMINSALVSAQQRKRYYWTNWHVEQPEDRGILLKDILETGYADREKSRVIISSIGRTTEREHFKKNQGQFVFEPVGAALRTSEDEQGKFKRLEVNRQEKSNALTSIQTDSLVCSPIRVGQIGKGGQGQRIYSVRGKSVSLSANGGGKGAKTGLYKIDLPDGDYIVHKLTPRECARLQTYPEQCFDVADISNTQWYKAFGNGWTVDVIAHIFNALKEEQ